MMASRRLAIVLAFALAASASIAAQQQPPQPTPPEHTAVISFIAPIAGPTVNQLLAVVNQQMAQGVKKITILISSPGGDTASGFVAYNFLRGLPLEITTFNVGNVDSAAMLVYCAGKNRYSLPGSTRFLIHGNSLTVPPNVPIDAAMLDAQLQQLKNLNQMVIQAVLSAAPNKKRPEIEAAVSGQVILSPDQAKDWGLVQQIRTDFMEPGIIPIQVSAVLPEVPELARPEFSFSSVASPTAPKKMN